MTGVNVRLVKGGEGELTLGEGERCTLSSTAPSPPGSLLDVKLDEATTIRIKVRGCKKMDERFHIDGRIVDLSRALRERLDLLVSVAPGATTPRAR